MPYQTFNFDQLEYTTEGITLHEKMTYSDVISTGYCVVGNICFVRVCAKANGDWSEVKIITGLPRSKLYNFRFEGDMYVASDPTGRGQCDNQCHIINETDGTASFKATTIYSKYLTYHAAYEIEENPLQNNAYVMLLVRHIYQGAKVTIDLYIDDVIVETLGSATELIKTARCFKSKEVAIRNDGTQKIYAVATIHDPGLSGIMCEAWLCINNVRKNIFGWGTTVMTKVATDTSNTYTV